MWAYRNGILIAQLHASWTPVSGGHVLASRQLGSFYQDGALAASIVSTVSGGGGGGDCSTTEEGCILMTENDESLGAKVAAPMFAALDKVGCWLGPKAAYAAVQCFGVTSVFVGETFVLGAATWVGGPYAAEAVMAAAWWVGWPLWTHAMYEMLACFDSRGEQIVRRGRTRCGANPRASGCGGGGGGGAGF